MSAFVKVEAVDRHVAECDAQRSVPTILRLDAIGAHDLGRIRELIRLTSSTVRSVAHCIQR